MRPARIGFDAILAIMVLVPHLQAGEFCNPQFLYCNATEWCDSGTELSLGATYEVWLHLVGETSGPVPAVTHAFASAQAAAIYWQDAAPVCAPLCGDFQMMCTEGPFLGFDMDESDDILADKISSHASEGIIMDKVTGHGMADAYAEWNPDPAIAVTTHTKAHASIIKRNWSLDGTVLACDFAQTGSGGGVFTAFSSAQMWVGPATGHWQGRMKINKTLSSTEDFGCDAPAPAGTCPDPAADLLAAHFMSTIVDWEIPGQPAEQAVLQGVIAEFDDGCIVRLGLLADEVFEPVPSGDVQTIDAELTVDFMPSAPASQSVATSRSDTFTKFGDMNADGLICNNDRGLLVDLVGAALSEPDYTPRGDFDLSGNIGASDVQAFDEQLAELVDCNVNGIPDNCELADGVAEDLDGDGVLDECSCAWIIADCADHDHDGVRDDNCTWWGCQAGTCTGTPVVFADMGGPFGECSPDGTADGNDRFHALNCFSNQDELGNAGYPCEDAPPAAFNVDVVGQFGSCTPDGVCDGNEAFAALNAFSGDTTCSCPGSGPAPVGGSSPPTVDRARVVLVPAASTVRPGGLVEVDVYLRSEVQDLRGYQLHVAARGAKRGAMDLVDLAIHDRPDQALAPGADWTAFNTRTAQLVAGLNGDGRAASAGAYLATFTYRASDDAAGAFIVDLLHGDPAGQGRTFLFPTPAHARIAIDAVEPAVIEVTAAPPQHRQAARR